MRSGAGLPRCIVFNKPFGVPSQFSDPAGEFGRTLRDYVSVPGVYPVGRMDRDGGGHDGERYTWARVLVGTYRDGRLAMLCDFDTDDEDAAFTYAHEMASR